jgi:two-component system, cell cycle sensor histidine kinase and response regulator CckA
MVVEDEPPVQRVTCQHLEDAGYDCVKADNAAGALNLLAGSRLPDLLVLDIRLPDLPGPELALRIHSRYPRIPVLFVSGWIDGLADGARLGVLQWDFLQKPFTGDTLVDTVRRILGSPV